MFAVFDLTDNEPFLHTRKAFFITEKIMNERLFIFDTTLRDGEQVPGCQLNTVEKIQVAKALENLGVDVIEAGFPVSSPCDFNSVVGRGVSFSVVNGCLRF